MRKALQVLFFSIIFLFFIDTLAYANIAPLRVKDEGVEPMENSPVKIESAEITVQPDNTGFKFNCNYVLKGFTDSEDLLIGIPGDLGYTLEAGYIENINAAVNGRPVNFKTYDTARVLSDVWKNYNSPLHFKWYTFSLPVKQDTISNISITYNINWKIFEQNQRTPYYIVPFLMSTDKLFGDSIGSYKISYLSGLNDTISPPDTKVMINSMLEPNIISRAILMPSSTEGEISWKFESPDEFQDYRLVVLSYSKLSSEFTESLKLDAAVIQELKWAILNNNLERLASIFEDIAKQNITGSLKSSELGTAAYLSSEYYYRMGRLSKALEMLSLPDKTNIWPWDIKYQYIHSLSLSERGEYTELLEELTKLYQNKDFILLTGYAESEIEALTEILNKQEMESKAAEELKIPEVTPVPTDEKTDNAIHIRYWFIIIPLCIIIIVLLWIIYIKLKKR
ncbi:hypothetical protein OXPF_11340 [Oxobacter pfennigii]|uniref:Uncharacterized protein n=1 Tax=Oxobacter pfennigii TaxID=36849 RepID=A0A0P8WBD8_9CLOT|nr:hypothetical protein [Oxobacter pfennigii]KPU45242.1 hypothetical protein OXPF_11340 [Oxobacter pfennigii]